MLAVEEDKFYNWDYSEGSLDKISPSNADWPITILFWGNAEVDKIKDRYLSSLSWLFWSIIASKKYAALNDGEGWFIDSDRGRKNLFEINPPLEITCEGVTLRVEDVFVHIRFYANTSTDYNYNSAWEYYVLASTHLDDWPFEDWHGLPTIARNLVAMYLEDKGLKVVNPWAYFYNEDTPCRLETVDGKKHFNLHDGQAAAVYIPP